MKILLLCTVLLSGCSSVPSLVQKSADTNDSLRQGAEFILCRGISVGAWIRAYGDNAIKAQAWRTICSEPVTELPK